MLTIFTTCKDGRRQRNALDSWTRLKPRPEILLMGNEGGELASSFNARVLDIEYTDFSSGQRWDIDVPKQLSIVPIISSMFRVAQKNATNDVLCYCNSDIIHFQCLIDAVKVLKKTFYQYVASGQRWDVDVDEQTNINIELAKTGKLHPSSGNDYFIFPRDFNWSYMPPFAIGRGNWDTWITATMLEKGIRLVDLTKDVTAIHQNHETKHKFSPEFLWQKSRNTYLAGPKVHRAFVDLSRAPFLLKDGRIWKK